MINRLQPVALNNDNPPQDTVLQKSNASLPAFSLVLLLSPPHFRWHCSNMLEIQWEQKQHRLTHIETEGFHKWGYGWFSINDGFHKWWFIWGYDGFSINHPYWNPLKLHGKSQKENEWFGTPVHGLGNPQPMGASRFPTFQVSCANLRFLSGEMTPQGQKKQLD